MNLTAVILTTLYAFVLPIVLVIWWKKRSGVSFWPFVAGAVCFTLFAMVLERLLHQLCLVSDNAVSRAILASPVLYMLYGAFAAGIFEETGRLFGFKVLLRKQRQSATAVAYGIGHGGIEVILILGITYLIYLLALLGVPFGDAESTSALVGAAQSISFPLALLGMVERISALLLHIGLSMVVFVAASQPGKLWLYPVAILLHALMDAPAALYQYGILRSLAVLEVFVFVFGLACLLLGRRLLKNYDHLHAAQEPESGEDQMLTGA